MTKEQIQARLSAMRPMDFAGAEALAQEILKEARIPLHALHRLFWPGSPYTNRAQSVLRSLNELSVLPWLVVANKLTGTPQMQAMFDAYRAHEALAQRIHQMLRQMLSSRALIPPPALGGPVEMPPKPTRECDEAYLLLERLAKPDEDPPDRSAFLDLSEEERNEKIREMAAE